MDYWGITPPNLILKVISKRPSSSLAPRLLETHNPTFLPRTYRAIIARMFARTLCCID
jgi:hypothetical protein